MQNHVHLSIIHSRFNIVISDGQVSEGSVHKISQNTKISDKLKKMELLPLPN